MMMTLAQAHTLLPQSVLVGDGATALERVHSDTRTLKAGDLFVALRGERFDAHDFLAQARAAGAAAALAERGLAEAGLPGLLVGDTLAALQQLAAAWRRHLHVALIAVAGSNGKTTVTQMIAAILREWLGGAAFWTEGNLNNQFGVPLTLLRLRQDDSDWHRVGVVELGTNQPGEIAQLAALVAPAVALVNNTQREHQEFLHGLDAVARENGAVIEALAASGTAVFPAADPGTALWRRLAGARRVRTFALDDRGADVQGHAEWLAAEGCWRLSVDAPEGGTETTLAAPGRHNALNAVAAAAAALAAGATLAAVARGLAAFQPVAGRSRILAVERAGRRITLVDDAYNANPDSVLAAIEMLAAMPAPRWLVLGDMGEVGSEGEAFHVEVGRAAAVQGIDDFWAVGPLCAHAARAYDAARGGPVAAARHFADVPGLLAALAEAPAAAAVLVKGSRFMTMERVVRALQGGGGDAA